MIQTLDYLFRYILRIENQEIYLYLYNWDSLGSLIASKLDKPAKVLAASMELEVPANSWA